MKTHYDLSDEVFEAQFEDASMEPTLFSHEAHLRLAWIHIRKYGVEQAIDHICRQIAAFDAKYGDGTKYNTTVTIAAIKAVHHFMQRSAQTEFPAFLAENPRLKFNFKELMRAHYSRDIFNDPSARTSYLEPDLAAF